MGPVFCFLVNEIIIKVDVRLQSVFFFPHQGFNDLHKGIDLFLDGLGIDILAVAEDNDAF